MKKNCLRCLVSKFFSIFYLPKIPQRCPKCGGIVNVHFCRNSSGYDQYRCPKCKIIFSREDPTNYKDAPSVAYKRMKKLILARWT